MQQFMKGVGVSGTFSPNPVASDLSTGKVKLRYDPSNFPLPARTRVTGYAMNGDTTDNYVRVDGMYHWISEGLILWFRDPATGALTDTWTQAYIIFEFS